jgi:hypothetical protein
MKNTTVDQIESYKVHKASVDRARKECDNLEWKAMSLQAELDSVRKRQRELKESTRRADSPVRQALPDRTRTPEEEDMNDDYKIYMSATKGPEFTEEGEIIKEGDIFSMRVYKSNPALGPFPSAYIMNAFHRTYGNQMDTFTWTGCVDNKQFISFAVDPSTHTVVLLPYQ